MLSYKNLWNYCTINFKCLF